MIKIIGNYLHKDLYDLSRSFYEFLPYEKIGVLGENDFFAFPFIESLILDTSTYNFDFAVLVDQDCFITNKNAFSDLIDYAISKNIDMIGMPDGGVSRRIQNPIIINPFLCILNLKSIREKYNHDQVIDSNWNDGELTSFLPIHLMKTNYELADSETYYPIIFWMLRNGYKIEYLDANDGLEGSTILKNQNGVEFAYHTWEGRFWNETETHDRIEKVLNYCKSIAI